MAFVILLSLVGLITALDAWTTAGLVIVAASLAAFVILAAWGLIGVVRFAAELIESREE